MHYNELKERTSFFKRSEEGIAIMSGEFDKIIEKIEEKALKQGRIEGIEEGRLEGKAENKQEVARTMLADGSIPLDKIAKFSGLTIAEVERLKNCII